MPHADSSMIPTTVTTKAEFWEHIHLQVLALVGDQTSWVSNLANISSLVYHSMMDFKNFGTREGGPVVNWCGFYLDSCLFPPDSTQPTTLDDPSRILSLGPFCGKPACQHIRAEKGGGVCADAYLSKETLIVPDVEAYSGHIACDGDTKSEIVVPMKLRRSNALTHETEEVVLGVMDLDSIMHGAFDADDIEGLERVVNTLIISCKW